MAAVGSLGSTNSESAARSAAGSVSGGVMNGDTASPTTGTWSASSTSRIARKSAGPIRRIPARESPGIVMNVTVSARSTATPGLRTTHGHHYRRLEVRTVEVSSRRRNSVTHLGQPFAWCHHRKAQLAQFVFDPGSPGADAHLKSTSVSTDSECASHAILQGVRSGEVYIHVPIRRSARVAATASVDRALAATAERRASGVSRNRCRQYGAPGLATPADQF